MSIEKQLGRAVDWLMYRSYEHNRDRSPDIEAERWRKIYINAQDYEIIYQAKKSILKLNQVRERSL